MGPESLREKVERKVREEKKTRFLQENETRGWVYKMNKGIVRKPGDLQENLAHYLSKAEGDR